MRESFGDLWKMQGDAVCITTNGYVTAAGRGVMGRGVAAQAKRRFPGIEEALGQHVTENGNHTQVIAWWDGVAIVAFPVKHHWRDRADLDLIERSAQELVVLADNRHGKVRPWGRILLPRPGAGNGRRDWLTEVKPVIEPIVDDRVIIVAQPHEAPGAVRCMLCGSGSVARVHPCERCGATWDDVMETEPDPHGWGD
jgi:hypothetical protein